MLDGYIQHLLIPFIRKRELIVALKLCSCCYVGVFLPCFSPCIIGCSEIVVF